MEYKTFELILAKLHRVQEKDVGAFRSRLRVLRDMGVPMVDRPGKGSRVDYKFDDVWEAHFGLLLQEFGLPPLCVKALSGDPVRSTLEAEGLRSTDREHDVWAWILPVGFHKTGPTEEMNFTAHLGTLREIFAKIQGKRMPAMLGGLINMSQLTRELEREFAKHVK